MSAIVVKAFNGLKPISNTLLLDTSDATVANNVVLISGSLRPLKAMTPLKPLTKPIPKTIYRFDPENNQPEGNYWLEWAIDTDVMRSPIAQDQWDRLYWTNGTGQPQYAPASMVITGSTLPGGSYDLGVPEPTTAPTVTEFTEPKIVETVGRDYTLSFYRDSNQQGGPPGPVSTIQAVDNEPGEEALPVKFTNLTTDNRGDMLVTHKILWRKVDLKWRLVFPIPLAQTEYEDAFTVEEMANLDTHPEMPTTYANSSAGPQYPPIASAGEAKELKKIKREYVYTLHEFYFNDQKYTESHPMEYPIVVELDDTGIVTLSGLADFTGTAQFFRIYRKDADKTSYLMLQQIPVAQTEYVDVIADSRPQSQLERYGPIETAPSSLISAAWTGGESAGVVKRVYMVTYINVSGNESFRSPESEVVSVIDGKTEVALYHSEPIPDGVTKKRLYRQDIDVSAGVIVTNDANWKMVAENSASATQAVDAIPTAQLPGSGYSPELQDAPPSPKGAPTGKADIPAAVVPESRVYVYTLVTAYDEEGAPSPSSEVISCDPAEPVTLSLPGPPGGAYNLAKKRIYRSATGTQRTKFQYVGETNISSSTFVDDVRTAALGELLPSDGWIPPPKGLSGLRMMANGVAVGFVGNSLYFSEPNLPHAWPHEYPIDDHIVAIGTFGQSVAVLTNNYPYLFSGIDPAAMASTKMQLPQACSSKRSVVETGDGVLYASPDGMTMIGQSTSVVTLNVLSRELWQSYKPKEMQAFIHNGRIIVLYARPERGVLILDISGAGALLTTADINATDEITAGYYSPQRDILYFAQRAPGGVGNGTIMRFDDDPNVALTATWKSKLFRQGMQHNFGWAQVLCNGYAPNPEAFFYADGVLRYEKTIQNGEPFRLPSGFRALDWEIEIKSRTEITEVMMTSSSAQLQMV